MHVVSLIANARGTTERRIMHDYTPRQIMHIGGAMMLDRTFVLNTISAALGGKSSGKKKSRKPDGDPLRSVKQQNARAQGAVNHFDRAVPGGLTPGSKIYDMRDIKDQSQARLQLGAIMGQKLKES